MDSTDRYNKISGNNAEKPDAGLISGDRAFSFSGGDIIGKIRSKVRTPNAQVPLGLGRNPENDTLDSTASDEE